MDQPMCSNVGYLLSWISVSRLEYIMAPVYAYAVFAGLNVRLDSKVREA